MVRIVFVLALSFAGLWAQKFAPVEITPDKIRRMEQILSTKMSAMNIPGVTVAVGIGKEVKWTGAYGLSDLENMVPMKTSTVVRLASISKPITAVAVMQLVEAGKISLDGEVQTYVPSFPQKQWPLRIRHLLTHQGGVRHYEGEELNNTRYYSSVTKALEIFERDPLLFEPGTKFSYTTYGFNLLGAAVEAVAGAPFAEYMRENVWKPARMVTMDVDDTYRIIPNRSRGYRLNNDKLLTNCGLADTSYKIPGGGLIARAEDLVKFAIAVNTGVLLKRETVRDMFATQRFKDGSASGMGLGWGIDQIDGRRRMSHTGGQQGTTTHLVLYPAEGLSIAVMANLEQVKIEDITQPLARVLFGEGTTVAVR